MTIRPFVFLLLSAFPMLAFSQMAGMNPEEMKAIRTYCKADVERLCPGVQPGGGRIKACLMEKKEQMSVGCAQALQQLKKDKQ
ncbi:cysteine rich repeat-containing protein [Methylotetracoccus oryzae]|uniref:cysteine rich repeat-containing protein n=1 Tax=Methylotetracoccus oryzae TaxID=1919059 RepID=UPI001912B7BF|nr:cysteine rich repeat-containing protein [Methylotetracoccus oryzae]